MLYSTSSYYGSTRFNDAAYYVKRQMYASALGIVAMLFISRIPYKFWMQLSTLAYFVALVLCTAVIFVGTSAKGQSRWLRIGPIQFQPSEIAKIAVIIFLDAVHPPAQSVPFLAVEPHQPLNPVGRQGPLVSGMSGNGRKGTELDRLGFEFGIAHGGIRGAQRGTRVPVLPAPVPFCSPVLPPEHNILPRMRIRPQPFQP